VDGESWVVMVVVVVGGSRGVAAWAEGNQVVAGAAAADWAQAGTIEGLMWMASHVVGQGGGLHWLEATKLCLM
jgi:hypothetical protein